MLVFDELATDVELILDVQTQLNGWGLYPAHFCLDGDYGIKTQSALRQLATIKKFNSQQIDRHFAQILLNPETDILISTAENKQQVWQIFLDGELGFHQDNLAIRDYQITNSIYHQQINCYPSRLTQKPDRIEITSENVNDNLKWQCYPERGTIPTIDHQGLDFLHSDITQGCVCIGNFVDGEIKTQWLGRNALESVQFWSATKFIPLLNVVSQLNYRHPHSDIGDCVVKSSPDAQGISFAELAIDLVSYAHHYGSSNSLGAMFKRFSSYQGLDEWTKSLTGNQNLSFKGRYGEKDFYATPLLYDQQYEQVVLKAESAGETGANLVSAYDLTRLITMLGWHYHLNSYQRIPHVSWYNLAPIIEAMRFDRSRYFDVAIKRLGLQNVIKDTVIISKVGWGDSDERNRYEIVYTALVKFVDRRCYPHCLKTFALSLRSAMKLSPRNPDEEARRLDARLATEVTEILRQIIVDNN